MKKLSGAELGRKSIDEFKRTEKIPLVFVLDNIRSMHNVGSVFRTADAFALESILLCGITACPPHKDIQKTALGATESVAWQYFQTTREAICGLKEKGYKIFAVEQASGSIPLRSFSVSKEEKIALVLGNEVHGVSEDIMQLSDGCIEIPQSGTKHSLNVSVCAGIIAWELAG